MNDKTVIPVADLAIMGGVNEPAIELMALNETTAVAVFHDSGEYQGRAYDNMKLARTYFDRRAQRHLAQGGFSVPWARRHEVLMALVMHAMNEGLLTEVITANGARVTRQGVTAAKAKAKANGTHKGNGATPPFDGGTFKKGKVTPPVQAATVKAPRKRKGVTA